MRKEEIDVSELDDTEPSYDEHEKVWKVFDAEGNELRNKSGRSTWPHVGHIKNVLRQKPRQVREGAVMREFALVPTGNREEEKLE